jgi:Family of unknown function (DUF5691)/SWIM zinc finger
VLPSPTADQARALAPDPAAARAGEGLAVRRLWSATGRSEGAAWGLCQGSGASPYQVVVDFGGPAFKCSCPSRKFPCKHGLAILFLLAAEPAVFPVSDAPSWATEWLDSREKRAKAAVERAERPPEVDEAAREKRAQARERKVDAGLTELDQWLRDLVRRGLAAAKGEGYSFWDAAGARLVDAQAPSLGREVRALGGIANSGSSWAGTALAHVARLNLIVEAYRRIDQLPAELTADVRSLVGWTVKEDDLPREGAVVDRWLVIARTVSVDERLSVARTWLLGEATGRFALHLAFGAGGANPAPIGMPGASFRGAMVFYPSATPLRVVAPERPEPGPAVTVLPGGTDIPGAAAIFAGVLATNPFTVAWPVLLAGVTPFGRDGELFLRDATGAIVPATPPGVAAQLVAVAGGWPVSVVGLWSGQSVRVLSALADGRIVDLSAGSGGFGGDGDERAGDVSIGDDDWGRLVSTALLGTERAEVPEVELTEPLDEIARRDAPARVLGSAAAVAVRQRAGWLPAVDETPAPEPATADPRSLVSPKAAWLLHRVLENHPELLPEWLQYAGRAGSRPPDEDLPHLLATAARHEETRVALQPILGPRAVWLAAQIPELAAGFESPVTDLAEAWLAARGAPTRGALLGRLRESNPDSARLFVESAWADASTEDRAAAVEAIGRAPDAADEPLLVRALADRRMEVRVAAAGALAGLGGSDFAQRLEARSRDLLASAGRLRPSLAARLPEAWDQELESFGLVRKPPAGLGERAWWLRQLIALQPPRHWERWLGADPGALLERALRSDDARPILEGWVEAAVRHRDPNWALALLRESKVASGDKVPGADPIGLLDVLPADDRDSIVADRLSSVDVNVAAKLAARCPRPWSAALAAAAIDVLERAAAKPYPDQGLYELLRLSVRRTPVERLGALETALGDDGRSQRSGQIVDAIELLRLRGQMADAFAHP